MKKFNFLGIQLTDNANEQTIHKLLSEGSCIVTFVNPQAYYFLKNNDSYRDNLEQFDYVFCDGIGLIFAFMIFKKKGVSRLSFDTTSVSPIVFNFAQKYQKTIVFLGGRDKVTENARVTILKNYPTLNIPQVFTGFGSDIKKAKLYILSNNIDIVVCGMGVPYQEKFLIDLKNSGWGGVGFSCGGYFDQLEKGFNYYPELVNKLNIRFVYRLYKEPLRLAKRYVVYYGYFIYKVIKTYIHRF